MSSAVCRANTFTRVWSCVERSRSVQEKSTLRCKTKTVCVSLDVGVVQSNMRWQRNARPNKLFVSAEGRNVGPCCGFEVQINVKCKVVAWREGAVWNLNDVASSVSSWGPRWSRVIGHGWRPNENCRNNRHVRASRGEVSSFGRSVLC